jgi:pilus assembly protein Flp/PilA
MLAGFLGRFLGDDRGATAIEYALLASLIAVALLGTFIVFGDTVANLFSTGNVAEVIDARAQTLN